jgi:ATP-dependent exoDNAse (exonuclease V) alpha subunit
MLAAFDRLARRPGHKVSDRRLNQEIRKRPNLTPGQIKFARHLTQHDSALRIGIGYAGTGKTYTLGVCGAAWKRRRFQILNATRVLPAAPTGQASEVLADKIGVPCQTLTKQLGDYRLPLSAAVAHHARHFVRAARGKRTWRFRQPRPVKVTPKTLFLVDEAGAASTHLMHMLAETVERGGGTLCITGDPLQQQPVTSTAPLEALVRRYGAAVLTEVVRQDEPWLKATVPQFVAGRAGSVLAAYAARNRVTVRNSIAEAITQACLDWTEQGLLTPQRAVILANTNEQAEFANRLCQELPTASRLHPPFALDRHH